MKKGRSSYESAKEAVPQFWQEHYKAGKGKHVMGVYEINIDTTMEQEEFEYQNLHRVAAGA